VNARTQRRNIKSTKTEIGIKTRSMRNINIGIKIGVRAKIKDKDKDKKKDKSGHHDSAGDHSKKHHDKVGSFSDCYSTKSLSILSNYVPYDGQCPQIVSEEEA
jgi:hypothetical protein